MLALRELRASEGSSAGQFRRRSRSRIRTPISASSGGEAASSARPARTAVHWHDFDSIPVELPRRIKLGVVAINTSTERFKAAFTELEIYKREAN